MIEVCQVRKNLRLSQQQPSPTSASSNESQDLRHERLSEFSNVLFVLSKLRYSGSLASCKHVRLNPIADDACADRIRWKGFCVFQNPRKVGVFVPLQNQLPPALLQPLEIDRPISEYHVRFSRRRVESRYRPEASPPQAFSGASEIIVTSASSISPSSSTKLGRFSLRNEIPFMME